MASKIFGGASLSDIARSVKERAEPSPLDRPSAARPVLAAAELALTGRMLPALEREEFSAHVDVPIKGAPAQTLYTWRPGLTDVAPHCS